MQVTSYLHFSGQCEEAFRFYVECLNAQIEFMMPYEGSPAADHVPPEWRKKVLHATLRLGDGLLMGSDGPPAFQEKPQGFSVSLQLNDLQEAERIFNALSEKGTVKMPFGETFWSAGFGMLVDPFGIPWMINCSRAG